MKIGDLFSTIVKNKANNQRSLPIKSREFKKLGLTPEEFLEMTITKSNVKFFKKKK